MHKLRCPICKSEYVRGFKVCDSKERWWSQCISGKDHGTFVAVYDNGQEKEIKFPDQPWFTLNDNGSFIVEADRKHYPFN